MFNNKINDAKFLDELEVIVAQGLTENNNLEYKQKIPDKKEEYENLLYKPVCAFANGHGGYIVYGVSEKNSKYLLTGIEIQNEDQLKQKLSNSIEHSIEPKITGINIEIHQLKDLSKYILVIQILPSYTSPHRVIQSKIFYRRSASGTYQMDISEIRNIIIMTSSYINNINKFIDDRVNKVQKNLSLIPLAQGIRLILHVIPISSFINSYNFSVLQLKEKINLSADSQTVKPTLEGVLCYEPGANKYHHSLKYSLYFRNGVMEAVIVFPPDPNYIEDKPNLLPINGVEQYSTEIVMRAIENLSELGFFPPYILSFTLVGLGNAYLYIAPGRENKPFDRAVIQLSCEIQNITDTPNIILKPIFDIVWNTCGYEQSETFRIDSTK